MTGSLPEISSPLTFLLTRPLRDVTCASHHTHSLSGISTHTPLAGRDWRAYSYGLGTVISTHTPLAGRDVKRIFPSSVSVKFLLTRPLRDVTAMISLMILLLGISTHTPLAGRD